MTLKLYCYVDETGQDTQGQFFIVATVVIHHRREELRAVCEQIEHTTGKGRLKWREAAPARRLAYLQHILNQSAFIGVLYFSKFSDTRNYTAAMLTTIAAVLKDKAGDESYEATVLIDALPRPLERAVAVQLRRAGVLAKKVRGVKKDENEALIRLADAVCGWVRAAHAGSPALLALFEKAMSAGFVREVV